MKYIFRNLRSLLCNEPIVAMLMILCIMVSSLILHVAYGLYQNYSTKLLNNKIESSELQLTITDSSKITQSELKECVVSLPSEINRSIGMYLVTAKIEPFASNSFGMDIRFSVDNSKIAPCEMFSKNIKSQGQLIGEYFSSEQEATGEHVAIIPTSTIFLQFTETKEKDEELYVTIQNCPFRVIGKINSLPIPIIPFEALNEDTTFQGKITILMRDEKYLSKYEYSKITEHFLACFGDDISIPELILPDENSATLYRTIILISVIISLLSVINFVMLYQYILQIRRRKYALFRMHGCSRHKILWLSLGECALLMLPCYILASILYVKCLIPIFTPLYPNLVSSSSLKFYIVIFLCYFSVSLVVVLFMMIRFLLNTWIIQDIRGK